MSGGAPHLNHHVHGAALGSALRPEGDHPDPDGVPRPVAGLVRLDEAGDRRVPDRQLPLAGEQQASVEEALNGQQDGAVGQGGLGGATGGRLADAASC